MLKSRTIFFVLTLSSLVMVNVAKAAGGAPKVGRAAAAKYFQTNPQAVTENVRFPSSESESYSGGGDRYLSLGFSSYTKSDSFSWGNVNKETDIGKWGLDMNYRIGQYNSLLDYSLRVNYTEYEPNNQKANKMSFLLGVSLPDATSRFPLYFGAAAGLGIFFTQLPDESPASIDYQLYMGLRLFEVFDQTGFFIEGGLKNHLQLTSDGQLNGAYISAGAIFTF